ncbi:NAD(P)-dependent oxidoreductase [Bailinhaonella thermotolerans]|uniref:NAD-dependent epimerase/dehydratase family protein n=1 Tax=Bailinhaonella thermotolerans TaxID=1070861 RepID=A0A3A4AFP4_9ACTN|nr:NAD(P)H-binding protein [Bailinhaonella thermotolerans]RJL27179.1 NAD-dependent epimerase/dehydratase family protein [Bailinhaonella thermotolerans]
MGNFVVFGAGGRAGRQAVAEATRRGHRVTAVVRDPSRYDGPAGEGVRVAAGDVTDAADVAALAAGHDAAINAAAVIDSPEFFTGAARALVKGLGRAGVNRLVAVGLSALLPGPDGIRLVDAAGFPAQFRPFCHRHAEGLEVLRAEGGPLDWVYVSPSGDFDHEGERTGRYEIRHHGDLADRVSYADFAIALLDEAETPRHHHTHLAVS